MLTPLSTRAEEQDSDKTIGEYYYPSSYQQHYYCQIPFNYDANRFYHPNLYETNQYYTSLPSYSHTQDENSNPICTTAYHSPDGQSNEPFYPPIPTDQPITPYPVPFSNAMFPTSMEQAHCSTDYVSRRNLVVDCRQKDFFSHSRIYPTMALVDLIRSLWN